MKTKTISPEEYNQLPREQKRKLDRSLKKQGLEMPEILPRTAAMVTIDTELYMAGLKKLEQNNIDIGRFLDIAFTTLLNEN